MNEVDTLPSTWTFAELSEVCHVNMGQSPPSSTYNKDKVGLPFFQGKAEFTDLYPVPELWCSSPSKVAEKDDVLVSIRAPVGPTNLAPETCCIGRGLAALSPKNGINHRYVLHAMRARASELDRLGTGTTFKAVSGNVLKHFRIPLAPAAEQPRIVAKIEELFSELDAGVAALMRVKANLKRYRAAVLKAAAEGKLTEEWRRQNPAVEPADKLLARILDERRKKWEDDQLHRLTEGGKTPPRGWRERYKTPRSVIGGDLPALPEGWTWATFDQASCEVTVGHVGPMKDRYVAEGVPFLRSQNVRPLRYERAGLQYIPADFDDALAKSRLYGNELLVVRSGVNVGDACAFPAIVGRANCADLVITRPCRWLLAAYGAIYINSPVGRAALHLRRTGNAQPHFNIGAMEQTSFPVPPLREQEQIVAEVERCYSMADAVETEIEHGLKRAARLRQAILKRAFEGKLVPQDSSDEPASALLAKLREQQAAAAGTTSTSRPRGRKGKNVHV